MGQRNKPKERRQLLISLWELFFFSFIFLFYFFFSALQTQEAPVFFHLTATDNATFTAAVDQMSTVGFNMVIFSFGSGFNLESQDPAYLAAVKSMVQYAHARGIEVGREGNTEEKKIEAEKK